MRNTSQSSQNAKQEVYLYYYTIAYYKRQSMLFTVKLKWQKQRLNTAGWFLSVHQSKLPRSLTKRCVQRLTGLIHEDLTVIQYSKSRSHLKTPTNNTVDEVQPCDTTRVVNAARWKAMVESFLPVQYLLCQTRTDKTSRRMTLVSLVMTTILLSGVQLG